MELRIQFFGDVVDRQELLNGTQSVDIEGADASGEWSLSGSFSWNLGLLDYEGEGDLTLTRRDGAAIFGVVARAGLSNAGDGDLDEHDAFSIDYEIDGGSGEFRSAAGTASAGGVLTDGTFQGTWDLAITFD